MNKGILYTGVPSAEELSACPGIPSAERARRGRVAVLECVQSIPCNPCVTACPFGAISMDGGDITALPRLDEGKCTGCGRCIAVCPGLAITVIDDSHADHGTVDFPYEYLPFPKERDRVQAVGREGEVLCEATVEKVTQPDRQDGTRIVRIAVPNAFVHEVKSILRGGAADA